MNNITTDDNLLLWKISKLQGSSLVNMRESHSANLSGSNFKQKFPKKKSNGRETYTLGVDDVAS